MELPKKPSKLLRLVLEDISKVRKNPKYVLDMGTWHFFMGGKCHVCFAGAVISQSLKMNGEYDLDPMSFNSDIRKRLYALDSLRLGSIWEAICLDLGYSQDSFDKSGLPDKINIPVYEKADYRKWRRSLLDLADRLESAGY